MNDYYSNDKSHDGKHKQQHIRGIVCDVKNCVHNDCENNCTADCIAVGPSFATSCSDTVCATFKAKDQCHGCQG